MSYCRHLFLQPLCGKVSEAIQQHMQHCLNHHCDFFIYLTLCENDIKRGMCGRGWRKGGCRGIGRGGGGGDGEEVG